MADKIKIVVVDDEPDLCVLVKSILEEKGGYEVTTTSKALEAEDLIRQVNPKLILLDVVMPERKGTEIIAALKKDKALRRIPIIVVSGKGEMTYDKKKKEFRWLPNNPLAVKERANLPAVRGAEALAQAYTAEDYISKPFTSELLAQVVQDVLARFKPAEEPEGDSAI